ncbi:hypothetical protein GW943_00240 [Candidatus Parcubacteria bacterium]|uniref:SIS domain-containing protein n=1 Tax=Candidatus Kaiserbacteria bacterium CG10_big_fil_rev_8_21_14_0_10_47_16 TaxID=1974608 RepID=A0A2H0UF32_9BACT|nr:hypothetical protein [Candidatus Parcubacteria bacterium]PIR84276.1 MAG: hypothetical protein COU16_01615 [Candidatus Kaiserbacteria bacterium CG10_big_fil_rev_8_21_14_0_10_47_16]
MNPLQTLQTFDAQSLPNLDTVVLGALEFLETASIPKVTIPFKKPIIVGSANAHSVSKLLFADTAAVFANESTFAAVCSTHTDADGVVVLSASGSKHAVTVTEYALAHGMSVVLLTNTEKSPAVALLTPDHVHLFPKIREPYTYNVSTYLSMILGHSGEDPAAIRTWIEEKVAPICTPELAAYDAFCFLIPPQCAATAPMIVTKFDELFGPMLLGRVFTSEGAKHAKTVVDSPRECFISFGEENNLFGGVDTRITIPLPKDAGPAAMLAIAYYVVGTIQGVKPPFFKENIADYMEKTEELFGKKLSIIVE